MTLITWQDGGPLFKDGKVGTEQGCCCGCDCGNCSLTVKVNGIPIYVVLAGSPVMDGNFFYCDAANATLIECAGGPNYTTWCEDYFSTYNPGCPQGAQNQDWETTASGCEYRALACLYCSGASLTVRVAIFTYVGYGCRVCDGSFGTSTYVGKAWYRDYVLDRLPSCESEVEMSGGEEVPYDFASDCVMDPHLPGAYPEMTMGDMGCVCPLSVSLSCANPLP